MKKFSVLMMMAMVFVACGDDEPKVDDQVVICLDGQVENPITGMCESRSGDMSSTDDMSGGDMPDMGGADDMGMMTLPDTVDPMCVDGQYQEPSFDTTADLSAEIASYNAAQLKPFINSVLAKRYPTGRWLTENGLKNAQFDCVQQFVRDTSSARAVIGALSTVVHECGHAFDLDKGGFSSSYYAITESKSFTCREGDATDRGGKTFARNLIKGDDFNDKRKPCNGSNTPGCDFYADVYLDGGLSGSQGFNSLLEETTQYVNSLATAYAFRDFYTNSVSERDGILTFLWYTGRYLKMAREDYPEAYAHLVGDACWRESILTVWGRAWVYLELTKDLNNLGIDDDTLMQLVKDPAILGEIERVRQAQGCQ